MAFSCPSCNRALRVPEGMAGRRVKCPACATEFRLPAALVAAVPASAAPAPAAAIPADREPQTPEQLPPPQPDAPAPGGIRPEALEELQRVSNYRMVRKRLRASAIGSLLFGALALWMGINGFRVHPHPLYAVLAAIGALLLFDAGWIFISPTPGAMILDGCALITVGVWNIFITVYVIHAMIVAAGRGGRPHSFDIGFWGVVGLCQIVYGFQSFARYRRFRHMPVREPAADLVGRIDEIVKEINKSKPKTDPDLIEFQSQTFTAKIPWKGRLAADCATFVDRMGRDVIFARPEDVVFTPQGKVRPKKAATGSLQVGSQTLKATMSAESLARYQAWKDSSGVPCETGDGSPTDGEVSPE